MVSKQSGLTLVELLVSIVLTSLLLLGAGAMSLAMSKSAHNTAVNLQVQRDLVHVVETVQSDLRLAVRFEDLDTAVHPVSPGDLRVGYALYGIEYDASTGRYAETRLVDIQLTNSNRLYVGGRSVASNIAEFTLSSGEEPFLADVFVESISGQPFLYSGQLPMRLRVTVALRNSLAASPLLTDGPRVLSTTNNTAIIYWQADGDHTAVVEYWRQTVNPTVQTLAVDELDDTHTVTIAGLSKDTAYSYRLIIVDRFNRPVSSGLGMFETKK